MASMFTSSALDIKDTVNLSWQGKRTEVRQKSMAGKYVRTSLQFLTQTDVLLKLESVIHRSKEASEKTNVARGLRSVQESLVYGKRYLLFEEAYHLYSSFFPCSPDSQAFRDRLLDPEWGLNVVIVTQPLTSKVFVVLKDINGSGLVEFLNDFTLAFDEECHVQNKRDGIDCSTLSLLMNSIDTEYDRNVIRSIIAMIHSRPEIYNLGIDPTTAKRRTKEIVDAATEYENALVAGEDLVRLQLLEKQEKLKSEISEIEKTLQKKRDSWPEKRVGDLEEYEESLEERLRKVESLLRKEGKDAAEKVRRAAKRRGDSLIEENRVKRRRLGAKRPTGMDEDEESYLLQAIEDMSTAHGRRHDSVMYLNHRVKARDMLKIVNHRRIFKGKEPLKALSSVLARGKPKRANSIQAKRHSGQSLFCCKKPPKTEDSETELTHHQRAHVRNAVEDFCFTEADRNYAFIKSIDDKAYVRPGTSVGLRDVKQGRIYQLSDSTAARKLPKYDWVNEEVYVTPSTHRIFVKEPRTVGEKEAYVMTEDESFVFMRPKAQVGSSASVWSSEDFELRSRRPDLYEVPGSTFSVPFRAFCARVKDKVKHFVVAKVKVDVMMVTTETNCPFRKYDREVLSRTAEYLERASEMVSFAKMTDEELYHSAKIQAQVQSVVADMNALNKTEKTGSQLWEDYKLVIGKCEQMLKFFDELKLPAVRLWVLELTDAGPGVGCNNSAVQYRMVERILIHGLDKLVRVHRGRGDSGQNEAERTNACIGEALVTGETLNWEFFKRFEGMEEADIEALSLQEYEQLETERMKKNAWRAAHELADRVDGEPAPHGFLSCSVTPNITDQFFWDKEYLEKYTAAKSDAAKSKVPGNAYFRKLERFFEQHCKRGELYIEYVKGFCSSEESLCEFCKEWNGPSTGPVPRPYPDYSKPGFHYLPARNTPLADEQGNPRAVDDFQPRARLKELYRRKEITSSEQEKIKQFSTKYIVQEPLVRNYVLHLEHLDVLKRKRQRKEAARKTAKLQKTYDDYDWKEVYRSKQLSSLRVMELDKYLTHHKLSARAERMKKKDKVALVEAHIAMGSFADLQRQTDSEEEFEEGQDDVVLYEWGKDGLEEDPEVFCICRQPEDERFMICCDQCSEWFHAECINMPEEECEKYRENSDVDYVCQFCTVA